MFRFEMKTQDEMNALKRNLKIIEDEDYNLIYEGFYYFAPESTYFNSFYANKNQQAPIYFVLYENEMIVGVLKLGHYVREDYSFRSINYIDVHEDYRNQGVAKRLYSALNEWGKDNKDYIVGSILSEMGKEANLYDVRKSILVNSNNFDNESELYYFLKKGVALTS